MDGKILAQTVEEVFRTMMDLEVSPSQAISRDSRGQLMSAVHLSGEWNGALVIECDRQQACRFAGRFLTMEPPPAVTPEVCDVLGELANMIGGNMKSAVATGLNLSMPIVSDGAVGRLEICEGDVQDRLVFDSSDGPFWVTLMVEKEGAGQVSSCQHRAFSTD